MPPDVDHDPAPVAVPETMPATLCETCGEKLRRTPTGWEHFGVGQPYERMDLGG